LLGDKVHPSMVKCMGMGQLMCAAWALGTFSKFIKNN